MRLWLSWWTSSDEADSRLEDNSGTGMSLLLGLEVAAIGCCAVAIRVVLRMRVVGCRGAQQKVSRFQSRHERFSNRLPSSIACEVFEKSDHCKDKQVSDKRTKDRLKAHRARSL